MVPLEADLPESLVRRGLAVLLTLQGLLYLLLPLSGSSWSWGIFSPLHAEVAADLLPGGASPWDAYDGLVAGPLAMALFEAPWLLVLGRVGAVHVLATGTIALATTALSFVLLARFVSRRAALAGAALVAFPPPNTWFHQHVGAHHLLGLLAVVAALVLLGPADRSANPSVGRRTVGWVLLLGSFSISFGGIGVVLPLALWWVAAPVLRASPGARLQALRRDLSAPLIGLAVAASPVLYKALVHVPYGGGIPEGVMSAAGQTKPLFMRMPSLIDVPERLASMLFVEFPYGLHFGLHGLTVVGGLWAAAGGAAVGWLVWRAVRARDAAWVPLLAVPPGILLVGLVTGWFVFHPGDFEPFPRDSRHVLGLTLVLSWLLGVAVHELPPRPRVGAWLVVAILVVGSAYSQVATVRWSHLDEARWQTSWKLQGRVFAGYFASPTLSGAPEAAVAWCSRQSAQGRDDCLRGVAMGMGSALARETFRDHGEDLDALRDRCIELEGVAEGRASVDACFEGLGFGLSHAAFRTPDRGFRVCREAPQLTASERQRCASGVAWGAAQDFWNRPAAMRRWLSSLPGDERPIWAGGVGRLLHELNDSPPWVRARCAELVGGALVQRCVAAERAPSAP